MVICYFAELFNVLFINHIEGRKLRFNLQIIIFKKYYCLIVGNTVVYKYYNINDLFYSLKFFWAKLSTWQNNICKKKLWNLQRLETQYQMTLHLKSAMADSQWYPFTLSRLRMDEIS